MDRDDYSSELVRVWLFAKILAEMELDEMAEAQSRAQSFAPFVDPTLYIQNAAALNEDSIVTRVLRDARARLLKELPKFGEVIKNRMGGA